MSTELDLGALRALADVSAKMGYKVRLTPAELAALLAAAGERDALRAWMRMVCRRKESEPDIGMDQEIARAMEAAHDPEGFKAQCEQRLAVANERCVAANREVNALRAQTAALQAEVDACGAIIGQPPGAKGGHAEIIDATIKEHQAANAKLRAEVERLQAALGGLLDRLRPQDFRGDPRFADAALDCARAALATAAAKEVERGS